VAEADRRTVDEGADAVTINQQQLNQLREQAEALQAEVANFQDAMGRTEVTGTAAGGGVAISLTAAGDFLAVHLDPDLVEDSAAGELEDLVLAALRDAAGQLRERAAERTSSLATLFEGLGTH
jgi:DNA-binding YbaB/EbfC family protein